MQKLESQDIKSKLETYPDWIYDEEEGRLASGFEFGTFTEAMDFANGIATIAEESEHHPDILIHDYKFVTIFVTTHEVKGVTEKDIDFVKKVESELKEA